MGLRTQKIGAAAWAEGYTTTFSLIPSFGA